MSDVEAHDACQQTGRIMLLSTFEMVQGEGLERPCGWDSLTCCVTKATDQLLVHEIEVSRNKMRSLLDRNLFFQNQNALLKMVLRRG